MVRPFSAIAWALASLIVAGRPASAQSFLLKTQESGLSSARSLNGAAVADYDNDGDLDVYLVNSNNHDPQNPDTWSRLFQNNGNGGFSDVAASAGVSASSVSGYAARSMGIRFGAAWGDYDNDGDPDLLLTQVGPEILYRNDGDGTFTDVTATSGVSGDPSDLTESSSAAWWDYDNDGDLDLYISAWNSGPNRMYENDGTGVFKDVSEASGLRDAGSTWTSLPVDVNSDGLLDIYTVNDFGQNRIFVNNGDKTFSDETAERGLGDAGHGMGVTVDDFNNDGYFDIYVTNIYVEGVESNPLYLNDGTGRFENVARVHGVENADWAWGTRFFDCDHDGDLDLYVANGYFTQPAFPNRMFVNQLIETGEPSFKDVAASAGVDGRAEARGLVSFDYDNDGDLDLLVANQRPGQGAAETDGHPYLYENSTPHQNWLKVNLLGTESNRYGIGASVRIRVGSNSYVRQNHGIGFLGQSIQPMHFGIGPAEHVDAIEVRWPGGRAESFPGVTANQTVELTEGAGVATAIAHDGPGEARLDARIVSAYPNPTVRWVTFTILNPTLDLLTVDVLNVLGQIVASHPVTANRAGGQQLRIDLTGLPAGIYYYRLPNRKAQPLMKVQ